MRRTTEQRETRPTRLQVPDRVHPAHPKRLEPPTCRQDGGASARRPAPASGQPLGDCGGLARGRRLANLNAQWVVVCKRAGLEDVRIHDRRHSFASRALALGESLTMIGKLLGHRQVQTTARYAHLA